MEKFKGWSLLLCHGTTHYVPDDLDKDKILTVDSDPTSKPDLVLDIFKYKCNKTPIFDRVYLMFCPMDVGMLLSVLNNIVNGVLKDRGELIVPQGHMAQLVGREEIYPSLATHKLIIAAMKKRGFVKPRPYNTGYAYHPMMYRFQKNLAQI